MFADPLVLIGGVHDGFDFTESNFVQIPTKEEGTTRIMASSLPGTPTKVRIAHSVSGKGDSAVDRHLVSVTRDKAVGTSTSRCTVNLTVAVPRIGSAFSVVDVAGVVRYLTAFLGYTDDFPEGQRAVYEDIFAKLMRGEA